MPRILICDHDPASRTVLHSILNELGLGESIHLCDEHSCVETATSLIPGIIFIGIGRGDRTVSELIREITRIVRSPIIVTGMDIDTQTIREATAAGAAYFLSKPIRKQDATAAIEIALSHAAEIDTLKEQVEKLKETLESRKMIERAKGILMQQKGLSEDEAYRMMQTTAMNRRISLKEVAQRILRRG